VEQDDQTTAADATVDHDVHQGLLDALMGAGRALLRPAGTRGVMPATSLMISHREMSNARTARRARPLSPAITEFTKYWGDWWVSSDDGWLRITDTHLASRLDIAHARLDAAAEEGACRRSQEQASDRGEWS
jgi:hypothetical protein